MHIHAQLWLLSTDPDLSSPDLVFPQAPQLYKVETLSSWLLRPHKVNKTTSRNLQSSLILFFLLCLTCISQSCQRFLQGLLLRRPSPGFSQLPFLHVDSPLFSIERCLRACASDHTMSVSSPAPGASCHVGNTATLLSMNWVSPALRTLGAIAWPGSWRFSILSASLICQTAWLGNMEWLHPCFRSVQPLSRVWLFATPWTAALQAPLSITNSRTLLKLMSIESVMPSDHSHPLSSPSPLAFNLCQHQGLFRCCFCKWLLSVVSTLT